MQGLFFAHPSLKLRLASTEALKHRNIQCFCVSVAKELFSLPLHHAE